MGADNALFSKPKAEVWSKEFLPGRGWRLIDPHGNRQGGFYNCADRAQIAVDAAQARTDAARKRTVRSCLCCQREFQSEGIHNRLCDTCRRLGDGPVPCSVATSSRGARKVTR